jgi:D-3-phosphoglycerate dehydrogenase / 2-oxoglutarate reductase
MTRPKVLCTLALDPAGEALLAPVADILVPPDGSPATLKKMIGDADVLIVRTQLPPDLFDTPHRLRGVVRHGTGVDLIPMQAATAQALPVANVPGTNIDTVAEYCIGGVLALARQFIPMHSDLFNKGWNESRRHAGKTIELFGRTIGVIGAGAIGIRLAEICHHGFRMRALGYRRTPSALPAFIEAAAIDSLLAQSDVVSLNCPLTAETRHLIDARRIGLMKPNAILVNAARGAVTDEIALAGALRERRIAGAVIDVFEEQPLRRDHPFLALDNVLLTPHSAGLTQEATRRTSIGSAEEALRMLRGERPLNLVNAEIWVHPR